MGNRSLEEIAADLALADTVVADVRTELVRQRSFWGVQRHSNEVWLPILVEEVGETAQAMQKGSNAYKNTDADDIYTEVIQVAAVAISWAATIKANNRQSRYATGGERG